MWPTSERLCAQTRSANKFHDELGHVFVRAPVDERFPQGSREEATISADEKNWQRTSVVGQQIDNIVGQLARSIALCVFSRSCILHYDESADLFGKCLRRTCQVIGSHLDLAGYDRSTTKLLREVIAQRPAQPQRAV